jgi:hypothetical protein
MYENRHGRFTAVDPLLTSGKSANPQTFNRFVYVLNNPLSMTDPSGLQVATTPAGRWIRPIDNPSEPWTARWIPNNESIPDGWRTKSYSELVFQSYGEQIWQAQNPVDGTTADFDTRLAAEKALYGWTGGENQFLGNKIIDLAGKSDSLVSKISGYCLGYSLKLSPESPPGVMLTGIPSSRSLPILNPEFTPNATKVLQNITTSANAELAANPTLAKTLLSDAQYANGQSAPWLANMEYGNAVHRLVGQRIGQSPLHQQLFGVNRGAGPDFLGRGGANGLIFDITTTNPLTIQRHFARPYGDELQICTYQRPLSFETFPRQ